MLEKYRPVMNPKWPKAERRPRRWSSGEVLGVPPAPAEEALMLFYALILHGEMSAEELDLLFNVTPEDGEA